MWADPAQVYRTLQRLDWPIWLYSVISIAYLYWYCKQSGLQKTTKTNKKDDEYVLVTKANLNTT